MLHDNLKSLEMLSISTIRRSYEIIEKIRWLGSLRFLDLSRVYIVYIPPGTFSQLVKLEELYLPWDFLHWGCREKNGERVNARLNEVESLQLNAIKVGMISGSVLEEKFVRNLTRFQVFYGSSYFEDFVRQPGHSKQLVDMFDVDASDISASWIRALLRKCERLRLTRVSNLKNVMCLLIEEDSNRTGQLKEISIRDCNEIEYLDDDAIPERITSFSELNILELHRLQNLKEIICFSKKIEAACFSKLSCLEILDCTKLKHVFPVSLCKELRQLQSMTIDYCEEIEEIFCKDKAIDGYDQVVSSSHMEVETKLELSPKPRSNQKPENTTCPSSCSIVPAIFRRAKQSTGVPNHHQVEENTTKQSEKEADDLKMDYIVFPQLKVLRLASMPKLRILYEGNEAIEMPSLQELKIFNCNYVEALSYGPFNTPRLENIEINGTKYLVDGDLNLVLNKTLTDGGGEKEIRTSY